MEDDIKQINEIINKLDIIQDGVIIYVGKAKNLKNRLKSYFTGTVTGKTRRLVEDIDDFDYIVTSSELESLILEITLIKKYDPKYNILLKDDKTYPYIELTTSSSSSSSHSICFTIFSNCSSNSFNLLFS